jgi:hypothetical protein
MASDIQSHDLIIKTHLLMSSMAGTSMSQVLLGKQPVLV